MNPILQEPQMEYSYMLSGPRCFRGVEDLPYLMSPNVQPPPGIDQETFAAVRQAILQKGHMMQIMFSMVWIVVPNLIFDLGNGEGPLWKLPTWAFVLVIVMYLLSMIIVFPYAQFARFRAGVEEQAPWIEETTVYRMHFHTTRKYGVFVIGILTFTRKDYTEPELV